MKGRNCNPTGGRKRNQRERITRNKTVKEVIASANFEKRGNMGEEGGRGGIKTVREGEGRKSHNIRSY